MYVVVIALVLMSSVSAKIPMNIPGSPLNIPGLFDPMKQEQPERCCTPSSFTQNVYGTVTSVKEGELFQKSIGGNMAYDAVEEQIYSRLQTGFTNGTDEFISTIDFYKKGESYVIFERAEGKTCYKDELTASFPYECIPDQAHYVGSATLGDRALNVNIWSSFDESPFGDTSSVGIYTDECIPIKAQFKIQDHGTGKQVEITNAVANNFTLGICDEDEIFRVPDICDESALSGVQPKIPEGLMKIRGLIRRAGLFFGGK